MEGKCTISKNTIRIPCRVFGCGKPAKYRIGNPSGSPSGYYHLCEACTESLIDSMVDVVDSLKEAETEPDREPLPFDDSEENIDDDQVIEGEPEPIDPEEVKAETKAPVKKPAPKKKAVKKGAKK